MKTLTNTLTKPFSSYLVVAALTLLPSFGASAEFRAFEETTKIAQEVVTAIPAATATPPPEDCETECEFAEEEEELLQEAADEFLTPYSRDENEEDPDEELREATYAYFMLGAPVNTPLTNAMMVKACMDHGLSKDACRKIVRQFGVGACACLTAATNHCLRHTASGDARCTKTTRDMLTAITTALCPEWVLKVKK